MKKILVQSFATPAKQHYDLDELHKNHPHVTIGFHPSSMTDDQKDVFFEFLTQYANAKQNPNNAQAPSGALRDTPTMSRMPGAPPPPPNPL